MSAQTTCTHAAGIAAVLVAAAIRVGAWEPDLNDTLVGRGVTSALS